MRGSWQALQGCAWGLALLGLCLWAGPALAREAPAKAAVSRDMVWTVSSGNWRAIYFSSQDTRGRWTKPVQLSEDGVDSLLPCIVAGPAGKKYAVWVIRDELRLTIAYAVFAAHAWSEVRLVPDLPEEATMPFVAVDNAGVLWLVFAGNDGATQDDIYCMRLRQGKWSRPEQVNFGNDVPDINPCIEIDRKGAIQITWEGFRDGAYVLLTSRFAGDGWTEEQALSTGELERLQQQRQQFSEESVPNFVADRSMLFIRSNNE